MKYNILLSIAIVMLISFMMAGTVCAQEVKCQNVEAPEFEITGVFGGRNVTLTSTTEGAVIYYKEGSSDISLSDNMVDNGCTIFLEIFMGLFMQRLIKMVFGVQPVNLY